MLSSIIRTLASLQHMQRRYILLLLVSGIFVWTLSFHDVSDVVATSKATYESYRDEYFGSVNDDVLDDAGVVKENGDGALVVAGGVEEKEPAVEEEKKKEVQIEVHEEVLPVDAGVLPPDLVPVDEYVAVCASIKNQAKDMTEWLVHHYHHHGIRRFYIMDDGSDPPLSSYEYPGIPRSAITFTYQPRETRVLRMQIMFYKWCLQRYKEQHKWIAFIDADEFFETTGNETLREVLETFDNDESVGALGVNWKTHTSNGLLTRPDSVRKSFTECVVDIGKGPQGRVNRHIKSIVKPKKAIQPSGNPHKFRLKHGAKTVGEWGDEVTTVAFRQPMTRDRLALHHYATKSKAEYDEKTKRGSGQTNYKDGHFWDEIENQTGHEPCNEMANYSP